MDQCPTVLVVEDEALICMEIAEFLRDCGFRVIEAGTAEEAIQALQTGEPIHVVFTDIHMPGSMDGCDLALWVRRRRPGVRVVLTSGAAGAAEAAAELCEDGPLMVKPYDPREVERRIRQLLPR